jgi:hypothetical protein
MKEGLIEENLMKLELLVEKFLCYQELTVQLCLEED